MMKINITNNNNSHLDALYEDNANEHLNNVPVNVGTKEKKLNDR